jgi:hypothetical protein
MLTLELVLRCAAGTAARDRAVVQHSVHVDVESAAGGIVHAGHVVPGVERPDGAAVALDETAGPGDADRERAHSRVGAGLELPAPVLLGRDLTVVGRVARLEDPGADGHAAGHLQGRRVVQVDVVVETVELQGAAVLPRRPDGAVRQRSAEVVAGRVGESRARAGVEAIGPDDSRCRPGGGPEAVGEARGQECEEREERSAPRTRRPGKTKVMHDPVPFREAVG